MITGKAKDIAAYLLDLKDADKDKVFELKEHKERRSREANSYFHVLVEKLAQAQNPPVSIPYMKNMLIADYGQAQYIDGVQMIYKTNAPPEYMMELEHIHTKLIRIEVEKGANVYFYRVNRGTHTYNTAEMSMLISGTCEECRNVGVEYATPDEIAYMLHLWAEKQKTSGNASN